MKQPTPELAAFLANGWFATVDPGTNHPAAAVFRDGVLVAASRVKVPTKIGRLPSKVDFAEGERVRQIAYLVAAWILFQTNGARPNALVAEWPKAYKRGQSKNSADQLFPLAAIGAAIGTRLDVPIISPIPFEWIGNIPKDDELPDEQSWESPRGRLLRRRALPGEVERVVLSHDAVDAFGLGKWGLGHLEQRFSGAV